MIDTAALGALRLADVASYLRARGWHLDGTVGAFNRYAIGTNGSRQELDVPSSSEYRDFHMRIAEVLSALARFEKRSEADVFRDVGASGADVVRLRLVGADVEAGTVSLEDGARLIETARDALLASACAAVRPRALYGTRKPAEAVDYIRRVRLGQTEQGSFVVTVVSAVSPQLSAKEAGQLFEVDSVPYERRVTETFMTASAAASRAAVEAGTSGDLSPIERAVDSGASANLYDALAKMFIDRAYSAVELSVGWASNRPVPTTSPARVRLTREMAPTFAAASRQIRARAPREEFEVEGYVVQLGNENVSQDAGSVVIAAEVDGDTRRVRVPLSQQEYLVALESHKTASRVACSGRLAKSGRQYNLEDVHDFHVVGDQ